MKTNYLKSRHIGLNEQEQQHMLKTIGVNTIDELIAQTMPSDILLDEPLDLDEALTEQEHLATMNQMAAKNQLYRSYIGRGWYGSITPAVIQRNILENPVWYTSYTPYQAEISQGRLEALFVYQTMISDLTGLPLANCSLLDEATAAAEAVTMMRNLRSRDMVKAGVNKVLVDKKIFENTLSVMRTRAVGQGIELIMVNYEQVTTEWLTANGPFFGAIAPSALGHCTIAPKNGPFAVSHSVVTCS